MCVYIWRLISWLSLGTYIFWVESNVNKQICLTYLLFPHRAVGNVGEKGEGKTEDCFNYNDYWEDERGKK